MNKVLKAALTSSVAVCAQICLAVQVELKNSLRQVLTELWLETKREMSNVQVAL